MSARHMGDCADHRLPSAGGTEPTCCTLRGNLLPAPSDGARLCGGARRLRPILQEGYNSGIRLPQADCNVGQKMQQDNMGAPPDVSS